MGEEINIVVVGNVPPAEVEILRGRLGEVFGYDVSIYARIPMPGECYMERRGQYDAACILDRILRYPGFRVLGIVSGDIAIRDYNFLLGLAASPGRGAIISTFRLRTANSEVYFSRLLKEAMHELGHTFGLRHCNNNCVMRFSNTVFDVDNKPAEFCGECRGKIKEHLR